MKTECVSAPSENDTGSPIGPVIPFPPPFSFGPFAPPFQPADRVEAMTRAYEVFTERYALTKDGSES